MFQRAWRRLARLAQAVLQSPSPLCGGDEGRVAVHLCMYFVVVLLVVSPCSFEWCCVRKPARKKRTFLSGSVQTEKVRMLHPFMGRVTAMFGAQENNNKKSREKGQARGMGNTPSGADGPKNSGAAYDEARTTGRLCLSNFRLTAIPASSVCFLPAYHTPQFLK
jgi:hypothetical protein